MQLSSVPGLENVTAPSSASNGTTTTQTSGGPPVDTPVATPAASATPAGQPPVSYINILFLESVFNNN